MEGEEGLETSIDFNSKLHDTIVLLSNTSMCSFVSNIS